MVRKLWDEGWCDRAIELLDDEKRSNQETHSMVMSLIPLSVDEHSRIGQVLFKMRARGYTLDAESFKKVIMVSSLARKTKEVIECYDKQMLAECGTQPDQEVCQAVLNAMVVEKMLKAACEMVKDMVVRGFKPWLLLLFHKLASARMYEDAFTALEMVDSEEAHNDLIRVFGDAPEWLDKVGELIKQMLARGFTPCVMEFFQGLLEVGRVKDAYAALEMVGGEAAHCDFIRALCAVGRQGEAYQMVEVMIESHAEHVQKCFNTLLQELYHHDHELLLKAFYLMQKAIITAGFKPDVGSLKAFKYALEKAGRWREANYLQ